MGNNPDYSDFYQKGAKTMEQMKFENICIVQKLLTSMELLNELEDNFVYEIQEKVGSMMQENECGQDIELAQEVIEQDFYKLQKNKGELQEILKDLGEFRTNRHGLLEKVDIPCNLMRFVEETGIKLDEAEGENLLLESKNINIAFHMLQKLEHNRFMAKYSYDQ